MLATTRGFAASTLVATLTSAVLAQAGFTNESAQLQSFTRDGGGLGGAAWLDYDGDSDLDLFLTSGIGHPCALFRNNGDGTFTDIATQAGVADTAGSGGVIAGDIDNDGFPDLFLTGTGGFVNATQTPNKLFHNQGNGTFADISATANVPGAETSFSAAFGDVDNDGYLDLFIASPGSLATQTQHRNKLYRNNGNLTFTDISQSSGIDTALGACAVSFTDFDRDGLIDILISNCNDVALRPTPFEIFRNNGDLTFTDVAQTRQLTDTGFWMSVSLGDFDNDADMDLFATNTGTALGTRHALLRHRPGHVYRNIAVNAGVADWEFGWGSSFADFDNDSFLDLFYAGALPMPPFNVIGRGRASPGRLFENRGNSTFFQRAGGVPLDMSNMFTSGVAHADYDNDGFADVVVVVDTLSPTQLGKPVLLRAQPNANHWLTVKPVGTASNRGGVGAFVELWSGSLHTAREVYAGSSVLSSETPWPMFGLGDRTSATLRVSWPSGRVDIFPNLAVDRIVTLVEGTGANPASYTPFGSGCPGSVGAPRLEAPFNQLPWVGNAFSAVVRDLPPQAPTLMFLGFSNTSWGQIPLPFDLGPIGMPGCSLLVSPEITAAIQNPVGMAIWTIQIPDEPALVGGQFFNQAFVLDPGVNPIGAVVSNGATGTIGSH